MEPIAREEMYLAAAAGEYSGELPEPTTRLEYYLKKIKEAVENGSSVAPEDIDAAIEAYLNSHDADIVTEQELSDALAGYYDKGDMDTALAGKAAASHAHDDRYYTESEVDTLLSGKAAASHAHDDRYYTESEIDTALAGKVDKETNKSLMTADEHTKLDGIEIGAQVNTVTGVKGNAENDYRTGEINISPANIGLGNVDNTSDANKPISTATQTALDGKQNVLTFDNSPTENSDNPVKSGGVYSALAGKISTSAKGANGGVAELDANGKVPSSQLPSYVDDVLSYNSASAFPATGEDGKIYIAKDTNLSYRWAGSDYAVISPSLALGDTSSTAYRGDWGAEDRAAIGTLTNLQTTAKSDLVSAVNELKTALGGVQGTLTFDNVPTENSNNPVKSGGIYTALAGKQDTLTIDSAPTSGSENPVESGGVYTALSGKQNTLTFDSTPTENSTNPVTSGGIYNALAGKQNSLTIDGSPTENSTNPVTSGSVYTALTGKADVNHNHSGVYAPASHTHTKSQITDLANAVASTNGSGGSAGLMSAADKEKLDKINIVVLTQAQYDAIASPDSGTLYLIPEEAEA